VPPAPPTTREDRRSPAIHSKINLLRQPGNGRENAESDSDQFERINFACSPETPPPLIVRAPVADPMKFPALLFLAAFSTSAAAAATADTHLPELTFLEHCVFVSVDVQEPGPRRHITDEEMPKEWRGFGFTAADVNAAVDYAFDTAYPNSRRVADACRAAGLPMIFVHWGALFRDGMDLDPTVRRTFLAEHGSDYTKWGHHFGDPSSRPAALLGVRDGEYVLPKTAQDAFTSSNIQFVLTKLGAKNLVLIGGHTGACLGKTAASAKRLGYKILVVHDATFDARESARLRCIEETGYDYAVSTAEFEQLLREANREKASASHPHGR